MLVSPFSFGNICRLWPSAVEARQQEEAEGHSAAVEDNTREEDTAVEGDTHQAALVEAAEPYQALVDKHTQGVEGPS